MKLVEGRKVALALAIGILLVGAAILTGWSTGGAIPGGRTIDGTADGSGHHALRLLDDEEAAAHGASEGHHEAAGHDGHDAAVIENAHALNLAATEWTFTPNLVTAKLGEPVTIVLENEGLVEHEVAIEAFGLHLHTAPGATMKGSFVPDRIGVFEFACEIPGHRETGMVGTLVVTG